MEERGSADEFALMKLHRGEAEALIASADAWFGSLVREASRGFGAKPPATELADQLTLTVAHTVRTCVHAADMPFGAAGARSLYRSNDLERAWRDLRAAGQHLHAKELHYAEAGQAILERQAPS